MSDKWREDVRFIVQNTASYQQAASILRVSKSRVHDWVHGHSSPKSWHIRRAIQRVRIRLEHEIRMDDCSI